MNSGFDWAGPFPAQGVGVPSNAQELSFSGSAFLEVREDLTECGIQIWKDHVQVKHPTHQTITLSHSFFF